MYKYKWVSMDTRMESAATQPVGWISYSIGVTTSAG